MSTTDRVIPASTLTTRLEKIRAKTLSLTQQIEDLRREEKLLVSILEDALDPAESSSASTNGAGPARQERAKGVTEGIVGLINARSGITRDELVDGLKHLNVNPFDQNAARRTILNNLGNLIRSERIKEDEDGRLYPPELVG